MSTQSLDSGIYDLFSTLQLLHEAAISVLVTTIYGRWRTITAGCPTLGVNSIIDTNVNQTCVNDA